MFNEKTIYRKAHSFKEGKGQFGEFGHEKSVLPRGFHMSSKSKPLSRNLIFERDIPVTLRDGTTIYTDVFRPETEEPVPVIIAWSPYGKNANRAHIFTSMVKMVGVDERSLSNLAKWEGPDPEFWCSKGYAVCHPDARGSFHSEGDICFFNEQEGEDGADLVEWLAQQDWCSGKIALSGNSWLAVSQWFIAAQQPPHLTVIAPWEGFSDVYRDIFMMGGIPDMDFLGMVNGLLWGNNRIEDLVAAGKEYPLMNDYWESKAVDFSKITLPVYAVASYSSTVHTNGTFRTWENIASEEKWLRIHNLQEWPDFALNQEDLLCFFDHYLKGIDNGWEKTPKVRYSMLDMRRNDQVNIPAQSFPPENTKEVSYYLNSADMSLSTTAPASQKSVTYHSERKKEKVSFDITFDREVQFTGYPSLKLWVQAPDHNNMDLFALLQKLDEKGKPLAVLCEEKLHPVFRIMSLNNNGTVLNYRGSQGRLRTSLRHIDPERSTRWTPFFSFDHEEPMTPEEIIPVEIPLSPIGMKFSKGETLRISISGHSLLGASLFPVHGIHPDNKGRHILYTGGQYDTRLELQELI